MALHSLVLCLLALGAVLPSEVSCLAVPRPKLMSRAALTAYVLPQNDTGVTYRPANISVKQAGFQYGAPVAGGPFYPTGSLAATRIAADQAAIQADQNPITAAIQTDTQESVSAAASYNGLRTLNDYAQVYNGHFKTTLPNGPLPGMLTNYTQDLLFSMERLSISPYAIRRLNPALDTLQFSVDDGTALKLTTMTLVQLFQAGRLFYADYRDQLLLTPNDRFTAAVDAFFYISPTSGQFLPLAIRSNVGAGLIYTPADSPSDWLLAKIMYNANDFWFAQWNHLAGTHEVVQIAYLAAMRSLSDLHPVLGLLNRLTYEIFAFQPLAAALLFAPGGAVDAIFPYTGAAAQTYTTNLYQNVGSGRFQDNYFNTDLQSRGLINCAYGPALMNFPFLEDGMVILTAIRTFVAAFVNGYYRSDADIMADKEVQAWWAEAQGPAQAISFPSITTKTTLIDVLTHIVSTIRSWKFSRKHVLTLPPQAHLVSTAHHTVNTNELLSASSTLPFHTPALYQPPPMVKGNTSVVSFLPPFAKVEAQLSVAALFVRPFFPGTNATLIHMFDDPIMMSRMPPVSQSANASFVQTMQLFSQRVAARRFDANGLSQGMPFVWQALDPNVVPYWLTA